ncbi:MAG: hypothetical protein H5U24_18165 [Thioclava marina]|uniref:hypothetical protein n=1 Tax=Thioclava marina TaxID=1915077 RepID=UPI00198A85E6|nr:hypothetical protein [Thioclava marina]MBC7147302.1 hypothetical protein [Thioclava marina]
MTTTTYFEKIVKDASSDGEVHVDVGKTNYAGEGPQMYVRLGESYVILSHEDAKEFCAGVAAVGRYFSYPE